MGLPIASELVTVLMKNPFLAYFTVLFILSSDSFFLSPIPSLKKSSLTSAAAMAISEQSLFFAFRSTL